MRFDRTKLVGGKMQSLVLNDPGNPVEGKIGVRDFQLLVGQGPKATRQYNPQQCGSGGTFFVIGTTPILIAGGCGGTHTPVDEPNAAVLAPVSALPNGGTGGRNQKSEYGGGGGFQTNGGGPDLIGGRSFLNGGGGGESTASINPVRFYGGFGGGGAGLGDTTQRSSLGGGGGYTGGDGIGYVIANGSRYGNPGTSYAHPDLTPTIGRTAVYPADNSVNNGRCVVTFLEPR